MAENENKQSFFQRIMHAMAWSYSFNDDVRERQLLPSVRGFLVEIGATSSSTNVIGKSPHGTTHDAKGQRDEALQSNSAIPSSQSFSSARYDSLAIRVPRGPTL